MGAVGKTTLGLFGLSLATAAVLSVTDFAFAASQAMGRSGGKPSGAARMQRQRPIARPLQRAGIVAVGGESEPQIIIIQPPAPTPVAGERAAPAAARTYVQPRWVDGGHGVQVLEPGHWVESKPVSKP
jgi:hypothetical protein